ncbi:glycosyltransferase family 2 protein [Spirochaeta cellobiosiphila]|uniref:glycosyltransferase family 2 protein n=1 Tax=Spirochaeta cellobiosiphila TaxID=504483 RepID=UPI0003FE2CD4|nr:glycosyltransferase family 2 protein [Spirochaeta cellobiosiphila]
MKLIIQIPCYNEAGTLAEALSYLPRKVEGFDIVEWLIINDGSKDDTKEIAIKNGVDYIVDFPKNKGLAEGFKAGIFESIKQNADVIVNTDADNQYNANDIPKLVQPILNGEAEVVIGERPISNIGHFSPIKKALQKLGSYVVRRISNTDVPDAPSGFRAFSKDAAMRLNVYNSYTYTLETIIQAGRYNMAIASVPVRINEDLRPSRLVSSIPSYIKKSMGTMFRIFVVYQPFRFFFNIGIVFMLLALLLGIRYLFFFSIGDGNGHIQSLILTSILAGFGVQTILTSFIADIISVNRKLMEDIKYENRCSLYNKQSFNSEQN